MKEEKQVKCDPTFASKLLPFFPHRFQKRSTPVGGANGRWGGGWAVEGNIFLSPNSMQKRLIYLSCTRVRRGSSVQCL